MRKEEKVIFDNLQAIDPIAAQAYSRLLAELPYNEKDFFAPVVGHCAREILNLITRPLNSIRTRDDILNFLHVPTLDFDENALLNKEDDEKTISMWKVYTFSPKILYSEA